MKDFITLCNDIFNGSSYRSNSGSKNRRKETQKPLPFGISRQIFHKGRSGEPSRTKSVFLLLLLGFCGIITGCLILIANPYDLIFKFKINLSNGGEIFELWRIPPVELYLRVFLFNVTNREAFLAGKEKLRVQEVGPYVYREFMKHSNVSFNNNGTLSSIPKHPLEWVPEMSNGTEDDILVLPNIALLSFANVMLGKPYITQMMVNLWIRQTDSQPLVEMTAKQFMFGYKSHLVTLGNKLLPSWIHFDKLGLIDRMYDFEGDVATFFTGETEIRKTGLIATYNRSPKLPQWDLPCGHVTNSSDGTKFDSFIKENDTLRFFRKSLCRSVPLTRSGNETYRHGLRGYEYNFIENALDNGVFNSENKCFCRQGKCLPWGLIDVTDCYYGFPIALSYPHFFNSDPKLVEDVLGSHPDPAKHETYFIVQPETGLPLEVAVRMQINMAFGDLTPMARVGQFKHMVLPLLWTEIRMYDLPPQLITLFTMYINILPKFQEVLIYLLIIGGTVSLFVAIIKLLRSTSKDGGNYSKNFPLRTPDLSEKESKSTKSPLLPSKHVIPDIIDRGKQVLFGKKKTHLPKNNSVYKDTTRRRSSLAEMLTLVRRDSKGKLGKTKAQVYEGKKSKKDQTEDKLLRSSTDSETDSNSEKKHVSPFYGEDNKNFSETEENLTKLLKESKGERTDGEEGSRDDFDTFEVDVTMLDSLKEDIV